LITEVSSAGPTPPSLKEFAERHGDTLKELEPIVQVAVDEGQFVRLSPQIIMDRRVLESLRMRLVEHFRESATAKVGEIREQWGITRKHAVPIFEFFDECHITSREGDLRTAGPRLSLPIDEVIT
jgi:selenocysteine-specific elongation factor